ncbi:MAG TPA: hypothetical protein VE710_15955 [Candidatus Bathyarchaeia archaeon]|nr:hypothetical protein [Candidatus Bathyarchaeia archaeon]
MQVLKGLKRNIWINIEQSDDFEEFDLTDEHTDVIVTFSNRSKWVASFYTYKNIETIRKQRQKSGENLSGGYFWTTDLILIDEVSRKRIEAVIEDLIKEDGFKYVFARADDITEEYEYLYVPGFFD